MSFDEVATKYRLELAHIEREVEMAKRAMAPKSKLVAVCEAGYCHELKITRKGIGPLNIPSGRFTLIEFEVSDEWQKYTALVSSPLDESFRPRFDMNRPVVIRVDSGCETGQLFHDLTCDCKDQLHKALKEISDAGQGLLIHIPRQDGRGMGLSFKLATLSLQDKLGVDTVESANLLEPNNTRDRRTYSGVIAVLKFLEVPLDTQLQLATNNPKKLSVFSENGYHVEMTECIIPPTQLTKHHLLAKQVHLGHRNLIQESEH